MYYFQLRDSGGNVLAAGDEAAIGRAYLGHDGATVTVRRAGNHWVAACRTISGYRSPLHVDLPVAEYPTEDEATVALYFRAFKWAADDVRFDVLTRDEILNEIAEAGSYYELESVVEQICEPLPRLSGTTFAELAVSAAAVDPDAARLLAAAEARQAELRP